MDTASTAAPATEAALEDVDIEEAEELNTEDLDTRPKNDDGLHQCRYCLRPSSQCKFRVAAGYECSTCAIFFDWSYAPGGFTKDEMQASIQKTEKSQKQHTADVQKFENPEDPADSKKRVRSSDDPRLPAKK